MCGLGAAVMVQVGGVLCRARLGLVGFQCWGFLGGLSSRGQKGVPDLEPLQPYTP